MEKGTVILVGGTWTKVRGMVAVIALAVAMVLSAGAVVLLPAGMVFAATTACSTTNGSTTCSTTNSAGSVVGTCTVTGASSCTPDVAGSTVSGNTGAGLNPSTAKVLEKDLTPNIGAVLGNPVLAPIIRAVILVFTGFALYHLFLSFWMLIRKLGEQRTQGVKHENLHGALLSVGLLLLLASGVVVYLIFGVVQGATRLFG
jgi:hypothetical protein